MRISTLTVWIGAGLFTWALTIWVLIFWDSHMYRLCIIYPVPCRLQIKSNSWRGAGLLSALTGKWMPYWIFYQNAAISTDSAVRVCWFAPFHNITFRWATQHMKQQVYGCWRQIYYLRVFLLQDDNCGYIQRIEQVLYCIYQIRLTQV